MGEKKKKKKTNMEPYHAIYSLFIDESIVCGM